MSDISADDVIHVAKLARLELSPAEIEKYTAELGDVLHHIAVIGELDLDGVVPTTHVVTPDNALRPDVVTDSLPLELAAPRGSFTVPSPQVDND